MRNRFLIDARRRVVTVRASGEPPRAVSADETLGGGSVLPGLRIAARDIWE